MFAFILDFLQDFYYRFAVYAGHTDIGMSIYAGPADIRGAFYVGGTDINYIVYGSI